MLATPLPTVEVNPDSEPQAAVIWLHGLGADGHDFEPIVPQLRLPSSLAVRFIFPHAPEIAVTAFAGQVARAWFDFDPGQTGGSLPGLEKSVFKVKDLIQTEIDRGIPAERIVLAGFSQGGVLALTAGLRSRRKLAGILALSTFLPPQEGLAAGTVANGTTPILMCHGASDMMLPLALGQAARDTLMGAGFPVEWRQYPMGHEVCLDEIRHISEWFQRVLAVSPK